MFCHAVCTILMFYRLNLNTTTEESISCPSWRIMATHAWKLVFSYLVSVDYPAFMANDGIIANRSGDMRADIWDYFVSNLQALQLI